MKKVGDGPPGEQKKTALLILDMQESVVVHAFKRNEVISNILKLIEKARRDCTPVIWLQHSDENLKEESDSWQLVKELKPEPTELMISKRFGDAFEDTRLEAELNRLKVRRLVVVGAQTDACIRATIHGAFTRGFDTVLVSDAHTTEDLSSYGLPSPEKIIAFTNIYWTWQKGPGRQANVQKMADVQFK